MSKTGILAVSFGTSYPDALVKNIQAIEDAVGSAFPGLPVRRAFTSGMIIRKLKQIYRKLIVIVLISCAGGEKKQ